MNSMNATVTITLGKSDSLLRLELVMHNTAE